MCIGEPEVRCHEQVITGQPGSAWLTTAGATNPRLQDRSGDQGDAERDVRLGHRTLVLGRLHGDVNDPSHGEAGCEGLHGAVDVEKERTAAGVGQK